MLSKFESVDWALHYTDPKKPSCPWNQVFCLCWKKFNIYFLYPPCRILALMIHTAPHKLASIYKPICYSCFNIYNTNTWVIISKPLKNLGFIKYIMSCPAVFPFLVFKVYQWKCWLFLIQELVERLPPVSLTLISIQFQLLFGTFIHFTYKYNGNTQPNL